MQSSTNTFRLGWALSLLGLLAACSSNGTIKGTLIVTGAADNSAEVAIPGSSVQVGADGTFTFANIPAGPITVYATREGYTPASSTVTVLAGKITNVPLTLNRAPMAPQIIGVNAAPGIVPPGGNVTLTALAASLDGYPLNYAWTVPAGWTAVGPITQAVLVLTAPAKFSQSALAVVTVDDGQKISASSSVVVATSDDMAPTASIISTPTNPYLGVTVGLAAQASAANGQTVTFAWKLIATPQGSTATLAGASEVATSFKPDVVGVYIAQLVVTDQAGLASVPAVATVNVAAGPAVSALAVSVSATPSSPAVGQVVSLTANLTANQARPAAYAWTLAQKPTSSTLATIMGATAALASFTPDAPGRYLVQLVVTDQAGLASLPAQLWINAAPLPPTAVIGGTAPLAATINNALLLDGTASTGAPGDVLTYGWSVAAWPTGSHCANTSCLSAQGSGSQTKFTPDVGGSYSVLLTVTDAQEGQYTVASTTVAVLGAGSLVLTPGAPQTSTVRQTLPVSFTAQVLATDGHTVIPNVALTWTVSNGTFEQNSNSTSTNGTATAVVRAGRIAGTGKVSVFAPGLQGMAASTTFTAVADLPVAYALAVGVGTTDAPVPLTVKAVDAWGNLSTLNSSANTAAINLTVTSNTMGVAFGATAATGSISLTSPAQATITLAGGQFVGTLSDVSAEPITVSATRNGSGTPLPLQAWNTVLFDGIEAGNTHFNLYSTTTPLGVWAVENTTVNHGVEALGVQFTTAENLATQESNATTQSAFASASLVTVSFASNVTTTSVFDATNNCNAQTNFRVRMASGFGGNVVSVTPVNGYEITNNCSTGSAAGPSFGSTNGWVTETVDVTDAIGSGTGYLNFEASNVPDVAASAATPSSWYVDDVWVRSLGPSSLTGASVTTSIAAGVPTQLVVRQPSALPSTVFGNACLNGPPQYNIAMQLTDAHGNAAVGNPTVELDWSGQTGTVMPALPLMTGTPVNQTPSSLQVQLAAAYGSGTLYLTDTSADTLTLTPNALASGLTAGPAVNLTTLVYHCHNNGHGASWSDTVPASTFSQAQALAACQAQFGQGNCSTNGNYAYATTGQTCGGGNSAGWVYTGFSPAVSSPCSVGSPLSAGYTYNLVDYGDASCNCNGAVGQTSNLATVNARVWN